MGRGQSILDSTSLPPGLTMRWYLDESFDGLVQQAGKGRTLVDAIVIAAPLAGLLGTVNGMIETFASLADMALFSQSGGIAGGISEALITTELGLAVAIPGLVIGRLLGRRQERIENALEQLKDRACAREAADATVG